MKDDAIKHTKSDVFPPSVTPHSFFYLTFVKKYQTLQILSLLRNVVPNDCQNIVSDDKLEGTDKKVSSSVFSFFSALTPLPAFSWCHPVADSEEAFAELERCQHICFFDRRRICKQIFRSHEQMRRRSLTHAV